MSQHWTDKYTTTDIYGKPIPDKPRIIQIAACGHANTVLTQCDCTVFALDDRGRVWSMGNVDTEWRQLPELPSEENHGS